MQAKLPLLIYGFRDESQTPSRCRFTLRANTTNTQGMAAGTAFRGPVQALSDAVIVWQSLTYAMVEEELSFPPAGTDVHRVGVFIFDTTEPNQYAIVEIPGLNIVHLVQTGPTAGIDIDLTDPAIAALVAELTSGIWCNHWACTLTACIGAFFQWRD